MTSAREAILNRIRAGQDGAPVDIPRQYQQRGERNLEECIQLFSSRLVDYGCEILRTRGGDLTQHLNEICQEHRVVEIGVPPLLRSAWRPTTVRVVEDRNLEATTLQNLSGALTGCTLAVAETGSIFLAGGDEDGRRALTLLPDLHVCVVEEHRIVETLPEGIRAMAEHVLDRQRPVTIISGPSATSDIELTRVEGVHGPRRLVVLIVGPDRPRPKTDSSQAALRAQGPYSQ
jgi:L-lactate dehydrogenase complex protein LldG